MLPATAQVASQQGKYLGKNFNALARGEGFKPFRYRHFGSYVRHFSYSYANRCVRLILEI
jgi:NADH dehydrogenase FAD-containing subunit